MTCIAPEEFVELLETGRLDHPDPPVVRHLTQCAACRDAWAAIGAANEVLPSLRPLRKSFRFRAMPAMAAVLLLALLSSFLWLGGGGRDPGRASSPALQEAEKELQGLIEQLKSDDASSRERAERSLTDLVSRIGRDGIRWLRDQERRATHPEVKARLRSVLRRLIEPRVLWTATLEGSSFGALAPAVDDRVCLFSSQTSVSALDPASGKVLWRLPGDYRAHTAVTPGAVFVPVPKGPEVGILALRPLTGEKLWAHSIADLWRPPPEQPQSYYHDAALVPAGRWLYTGSRTGSLLCLDAATGARRWAAPPRGPKTSLFSPVIRGGTVFASEWHRALLAFDADTGKLRWQAEAPGIGTEAPVVLGDRVFVVTYDLGKGKADEVHGECIAFSATDGGLIWQTDLAAFGKGAVGLLDVGSTLVVQAKTHLVGVSSASGAVLWRLACNRFAYSTLARDDRGRVYAGSDDGTLLVVDASSGKRLLRFDPNSIPQADAAPKVSHGDGRRPDLGAAGCPAVVGRDVYLMTDSGLAIALRIPEFLDEGD